jgi:hypothetical protein
MVDRATVGKTLVVTELTTLNGGLDVTLPGTGTSAHIRKGAKIGGGLTVASNSALVSDPSSDALFVADGATVKGGLYLTRGSATNRANLSNAQKQLGLVVQNGAFVDHGLEATSLTVTGASSMNVVTVSSQTTTPVLTVSQTATVENATVNRQLRVMNASVFNGTSTFYTTTEFFGPTNFRGTVNVSNATLVSTPSTGSIQTASQFVDNVVTGAKIDFSSFGTGTTATAFQVNKTLEANAVNIRTGGSLQINSTSLLDVSSDAVRLNAGRAKEIVQIGGSSIRVDAGTATYASITVQGPKHLRLNEGSTVYVPTALQIPAYNNLSVTFNAGDRASDFNNWRGYSHALIGSGAVFGIGRAADDMKWMVDHNTGNMRTQGSVDAVFLLSRGSASINGNVVLSGSIDMGTSVRQNINLWSTLYGIGVQGDTLYNRTNHHFAWHKDGSHSDTPLDPGAGGVLQMSLDRNGLLTLPRKGISIPNEGGALSFGSKHGQHISLYDSSYGLGISSSTLYMRSGAQYIWYQGGSHTFTAEEATSGRVLMKLDSNGALYPAGGLGCPAGWWSLSGGRTCMAAGLTDAPWPNNMQGLMNHCASRGAKICRIADFKQACAMGLNPYATSGNTALTLNKYIALGDVVRQNVWLAIYPNLGTEAAYCGIHDVDTDADFGGAWVGSITNVRCCMY